MSDVLLDIPEAADVEEDCTNSSIATGNIIIS